MTATDRAEPATNSTEAPMHHGTLIASAKTLGEEISVLQGRGDPDQASMCLVGDWRESPSKRLRTRLPSNDFKV
eukprot:CAMPEP_0183555184 /NCGR_PEP_ID=MMETSP0371-20130417/79331_1 /TAXON_ID=268820 /ORGANISM="Peridinium aciculiferum, Strain PAER-2" /LENGTH=73 /DNA_ID=CAMNT_0025761311 /DNA_START=95 /DNA_END=314 /DNA_ORIENTATION=-